MGPKRSVQKPQATKAASSQKPRKLETKTRDLGEKQAILAEAESVDINLQQRILDTFKNSFAQLLDGDFSRPLQEVKTHLYNRDFHLAFSREEYLESYAVRWSPSRALAYRKIFAEVLTYLPSQGESDMQDPGILSATEYTEDHTSGPRNSLKAVCFGGGAGAELIAWAALYRPDGLSGDSQIKVHLLDIAAWDATLHKLFSSATTLPPLSPYASAAAKESNMALADRGCIQYSFSQADVLDLESWEALLRSLHGFRLITFMFTLSELYSASTTKATKLLMAVTDAVEKGTLLLVVDSPGSYSTLAMASSEKTYPMKWLLDRTLLDTAVDQDGNSKWEKVLSEDSRWFRLSPELKYPIELENMRYQIHLYRAR